MPPTKQKRPSPPRHDLEPLNNAESEITVETPDDITFDVDPPSEEFEVIGVGCYRKMPTMRD